MNSPTTVAIPDVPAPEEGSFSFTLPSGRKAIMCQPNGAHMISANKLLKGKPSSVELVLAIVNRVTLIDGKLMPYEAFLLLPIGDIMKLQEVMTERFLAGVGTTTEE